MRITNNMLMRTMMQNINTNLGRLEKLQQQMSTGKKIQAPSDDPIVAARALKLRTDVSEIEQYKKNVEDAMSWLDVTETAIASLSDIVQRARELAVQASNDGVLAEEDRLSIKAEISQLKSSLIEIGNTAYAGRYIFGGYSTDKPPFEIDSSNSIIGDKLLYNGNLLNPYGSILPPDSDADENELKAYYEEILKYYKGDESQNIKGVVGNKAGQAELIMANFNKVTTGEFTITLDGVPKLISLDASIGNDLDNVVSILNQKLEEVFPPVDKTIYVKDENGNEVYSETVTVSPIKVSKEGNRIKFTVQEGNSIKISGNDEVLKNLGFADGVESSVNRKQEIIYQIGVGNNIKINVEGNEIFGGKLQGLLDTFNKLEWALDGKTEYTTLIEDENGDFEIVRNSLKLSDLIEDLDQDLNQLLKIRADVGARSNFAEMTKNRLDDSLVNFTELMSNNEDADMAEVIIKLTNEENVYKASLSAGARLIQPTLLDFLS